MTASCRTVYYDNSCPLCAAEIGYYQRVASSAGIDFVDVSAAAPDLGPGLDRSSAMARFHVRDETGTLHSGAAAFVHLWSSLPGWRHVARVAKRPAILAMLEGLYRMFLPVRPLLSRAAGRLGRARRQRRSQT
jgi:predicted DCC family thiol-disulfide oxidoreductase YuxK